MIKHPCDGKDIAKIEEFCTRHHTLQLRQLPNGLYGAVASEEKTAERYRFAWIRDNVMVANYLYELGHNQAVQATLVALRDYFYKQRGRFTDIIANPQLAENPINRPHVRFNATTLDELTEEWNHDQNDALGYALWMTFRMANERGYVLNEKDFQVLAMFPFYFEAIKYWEDVDSGHWEERREEPCSSSIGVVVAGLQQMLRFIDTHESRRFAVNGRTVTGELMRELIEEGRNALDGLLPKESRTTRDVDAALLFLAYPLDVVSRVQADGIIANVVNHLQGEHGIKRYVGDSYWSANYKRNFDLERRTGKEDKSRDDRFISGTEAQWCIFDPVLSAIYGRRYLTSGRRDEEMLEQQTVYFNRTLRQLTPKDFRTEEGTLLPGQCAEAYYVEDSANIGVYVPNDHVPLAWTQANFGVALEYMKRSINVRTG